MIVGLAITGGFILALYLYDRKVRRIRELKAALIENVKQGPYAQAPQKEEDNNLEEDNNSKEEQER